MGDTTTPRLPVAAGYEPLAAVLDEALEQAQAGKGRERHASGEPFVEQPIVLINERIGSNHGAIYQACKKAQESARLPYERARAELKGAINYLAAAVIYLDRAKAAEVRDIYNLNLNRLGIGDLDAPIAAAPARVALEVGEAVDDPGLTKAGDL